ncbi:GntR-type HTH domain protein [Acididesulfobacillus acetoxydans]|uniref:Bacterial regulatory s, gntR protein n=1 Tax=Acididesulfobacillus acetoxydans TaxID=1561005 RepID=A0A8S0XUK2_9FIRM|nr:GntR family transcriptional regulator [Acididesulfobacillus acetoxydans]CAA7599507.1 GntR-type HTH domain protein [Acididesulfobacillus acetoxydans]CEJ09264.1 Bacterial regulatory s, gntR protein [Acididesulfobacillus acetoxydans]
MEYTIANGLINQAISANAGSWGDLMELDRHSGIPYYVQLKEQIRKRIAQDIWRAGIKLPTERELAAELAVSRNTVSQAYRELEREGLLASAQGKGTFVADTSLLIQREGRKEKVLRIIDMAMEEAVGLGFSLDDFVSFVYVRGMEKKELLGWLKVAFIECNPEQLGDARWNLGRGVTLLPLSLVELRESQRVRERLASMDMIVTGSSHLAEVKSLLGGSSVPFLGVSLRPRMETVVRVARLPSGMKVALITESVVFAGKVKESLSEAGLHPELVHLTRPEKGEMERTLRECGAAIVAPAWRGAVEQVLPGNMELIEYRFEPDEGSLNLLRGALLELKLKRPEAVPGAGP